MLVLAAAVVGDGARFERLGAARREESALLVGVRACAARLVLARVGLPSTASSALQVLAPGGIAALSSCSSHVSMQMFLELTEAAVSKARRRATVLGVYGQPADHPFPLVCRELQYLKFLLLQVR